MTSECHAACETARHDQEQHERAWLIAHGYLPALAPVQSAPMHACPARNGWFWSGSRENCPHCKIAAPAAGEGHD
jgi:hypothetical protein